MKCFKATLEFLEVIQRVYSLAGAKLKPCHFRVGLSDGILVKTLKRLIDLLAFKI